ncbi:glycosyltransferase family 10 domain-containing protein [Pedobacter sp. GR22-10]|uniref:glycosyltransferase family 10 domain-containing protein n=1 Tax=Pedobacter sp. GR22-10 TaxID=2994472 RepID=UPI002246482F|nr:glycosyltransferase family 10 [Pedobacter sp. GR22-10]MCX2431614.1 glycosyltransferase family 10 [Pedobacter sp. GR22-10]
MESKKNKVVLYNKTWRMKPEKEYSVQIGDEFEITTRRQYMDKAIAIIFHMPTLSADDVILDQSRKKKNQLWIFWSMECELNYEWQSQKKILDLFDIFATYKFDSDVPVPYLYSGHRESLKPKIVSKTQFVNAFISSDFNLSSRNEYLKDLMNYIDVDSYGKILNNKQLKDDEGEPSKLNTISKYKFSLAFENAISKDYVTEKFFQPLMAGSVPVYLGAPNIEEFAPGNNSYINVNSFDSVKSLANYLIFLNENEAEYHEFQKWRDLPFKDNFEEKLSIVSNDFLPRLCEIIKKKSSKYN